MNLLEDIERLNTEISKAHLEVRRLQERQKTAIGAYLISKGWRKTNRGWVEPGKLPTHTSTIYGTFAAFYSQKK